MAPKSQVVPVPVPVPASGPQRFGVGLSSAHDASAGAEAVTAALEGRSPCAGDLFVIFVGSPDPAAVHESALEAAGPAHVIGCGVPNAFTSDQRVQTGCVATYIPGGDLSLGVACAPLDGDLAGGARSAAALARERAGGRGPNSALLLLSDGTAGDQRETIRGAYEVTGALTPIVGGVAGFCAGSDFSATYQFAERRTLTGHVVTVWLDCPTPIGVGVRHGWRPVGRPMMVTRSEGNVIHELDGRPAREMYMAEHGELADAGNPRWKHFEPNFNGLVMDGPLGLPNASGRYDVRSIMSEAGDGLQMFGYVPEQSVVQVMASDADELLAGAAEAATDALAPLAGPARGALVFSCVARVVPLAERLAEEGQVISRALGDVPVGGFMTFGEFARVPGSTGFHNATAAVLAI